MVYRLDRLGRTLAANRVREKEATIVSLTDHFNSKTVSGQMMMNMIAVLAEYEHDLIIERCTDGRIAARTRGVKFGRPKGSGNTDAAKSCTILYNNGMAVSEIQKALKIKSNNTVYSVHKSGGHRACPP